MWYSTLIPPKYKVQGRTRGRGSWAPVRGLRRDWSNLKYGGSILRFTHAKEFLWTLSEISARPSNFYQLFRRPKISRTSFLRAPIYKLVRGEKLLICPRCSHASSWPRWSGCKINTQCSMDVSPKRNTIYNLTILAQYSIQYTTRTQIFGTKAPWRLNFVWWCLLFKFLSTKLLYVTNLLRWLINFWEICTPLP